HGVCGNYVLYVRPEGGTTSAGDGAEPCPTSEAASRGDVNLDGIVNTIDLVTLLANWGATTFVP
ncbi:MAG: hypothetical protein D6693_09425, partial [Planctomycetota bacterium]